MCEVSANWLRAVASDRGRNMTVADANSDRPVVFVHIPRIAGTSMQLKTYAFATNIGHLQIEKVRTQEDKYGTVWVMPNLLIHKKNLYK